MTIDQLCNQLNNRVFEYSALIVDYSVPMPMIVVCPRMTKKLVKKLHFDDLITFDCNGDAVMSERLQDYALELSDMKVIVLDRGMFFGNTRVTE